MHATPSHPVNQYPSSAKVNAAEHDPLDVTLPEDGTRQACGAIIALAVCSAFWAAVAALVLR